ncbi:MAG: lipid II flippase MurJ [Thermoanaerobaculia bacterium]
MESSSSEPAAPVRPRRRGLGALAVASGILFSRVAGLVRTSVLASIFGVGAHADVWSAALRLPNLLQNLLGEQTLSAAFIPVYSRLLGAGRKEEAGRFAGAVFSLLAALAGGAALVGVLLARPIVALFAPGFLGDQERIAQGLATVDRYQLAVLAVRWIFPMSAILVLSAWALGVLNSHRRFFLSYVAPVVWNASIIAAVWWVAAGRGAAPGGGEDRLLVAACAGALAGGLLQFLIQIPGVIRDLEGFRFGFRLGNPAVREAIAAFLPTVAGRGAVQFSSYIDQLLASWLVAGAIGALAYAQTLYLLPVSLFGLSLAAAAARPRPSARRGPLRGRRTRLAASPDALLLPEPPGVGGVSLAGATIGAGDLPAVRPALRGRGELARLRRSCGVRAGTACRHPGPRPAVGPLRGRRRALAGALLGPAGLGRRGARNSADAEPRSFSGLDPLGAECSGGEQHAPSRRSRTGARRFVRCLGGMVGPATEGPRDRARLPLARGRVPDAGALGRCGGSAPVGARRVASARRLAPVAPRVPRRHALRRRLPLLTRRSEPAQALGSAGKGARR